MVNVHEITAKSALHYHESKTPCNWDLNIYRGCGHGCRYCFARYSHTYLGTDKFFQDIYVKTNIAERLDRQLSARRWRGEAIKLGGVTDSYQPLEKQYELMPQILRKLIKHKNPCVITTKSSLIKRDIDLLAELARHTCVYVSFSVTTADEELEKVLEPGASPTKERFEALALCKKVGCHTTVMLVPVIPLITDGQENLEKLFQLSKQHNADSLLMWSLHLRGGTKPAFFRFLAQHFPSLRFAYRQLYSQGSKARKVYRNNLHELESKLRERYSIYAPEEEPVVQQGQQLTLPF